MSTRSQIMVMKPDESIRTIYCHSDGYLTWNGEALLTHYTDLAKVMELIELGDISSMDRSNGNVIAYMRDRGETGQEATDLDNLELFIGENWYDEYNYVFAPDGQWYWFPDDKLDEMKLLTQSDIEAAKKAAEKRQQEREKEYAKRAMEQEKRQKQDKALAAILDRIRRNEADKAEQEAKPKDTRSVAEILKASQEILKAEQNKSQQTT